MNWAWDSLDQVLRSPAFPTWLTLAAAGFFGVIVIVTLLRAEKSVANGALTVITLLAVGVALATTIPGFRGLGNAEDTRPQAAVIATPAPLACLDDLAGEPVLTVCEKALFGSAEQAAAAVSYASLQITRLAAFSDVAAANKSMTPELQALRHAVEHDRYGLIAYVLTIRDNCTPTDCTAFRLLTDRKQIASNMEVRVYETTISRYAPTWIAPLAQPPMPVAALVPGVPTGRPTNAEFPSSASTPPVSIMTPEPGTATASVSRANAPSTNAVSPSSRPAPAASAPAANAPSPRPASSASPTLAAAKKQPTPKPSRTPAPAASPVPIAPATSAPAASNE